MSKVGNLLVTFQENVQTRGLRITPLLRNSQPQGVTGAGKAYSMEYAFPQVFQYGDQFYLGTEEEQKSLWVADMQGLTEALRVILEDERLEVVILPACEPR